MKTIWELKCPSKNESADCDSACFIAVALPPPSGGQIILPYVCIRYNWIIQSLPL